MILDNVKATGTLTIEVTNEFGEVTQKLEENLVVGAGLAFLASRAINADTPVMSHMAIGTGTTAAAVEQTALVTEVARVALTSTTQVTTTVANDTVQYAASFPPGTGTGAITEAGVFNADTAGTMLNRTVFGVVTKGELDGMTITWKVKLQ